MKIKFTLERYNGELTEVFVENGQYWLADDDYKIVSVKAVDDDGNELPYLQ